AAQIVAAGAPVLAGKDMAGRLRPAAATRLVTALRERFDVPVHVHTHDTAGGQLATLLAASAAGADAVDAAAAPMSGTTSQPSLSGLVAALAHTDRDTGIDLAAVSDLEPYWEAVRHLYRPFESGLPGPTGRVYRHEIPGGQLSNLRQQAIALGLADDFELIEDMYAAADRILGRVPKVTPSSKVVGDMALMMVSQGLSRAQVEDPKSDVSFPDSVIDMMRGNLGQPPGGFPDGIVKKVLKSEKPNTERPGKHLAPADFDALRKELQDKFPDVEFDDEDFNGYLMYPKVFTDYVARHEEYGPVRVLPTMTYFYGMEPEEQITAEIDPGKTLEIRLITVGETQDDGEVRVFFELNGQPRTVRVPDRKAKASSAARPKAEVGNPNHIGAPMPGVVASVSVQAGAQVKEGDLLLTIEAMKMETGLHAERDATVKAVHVQPGGQIDAKDLLIELE
uniref:biotin/lipoyl-containing protein n=1 Tax=Salipiger sp. TaxID=2078585 RepID=UPI003513AC0C